VRHEFKTWINVAHPDLSKPFFSSLLVSRFRSSLDFAARSEANFGIEGHEQLYDSSAALNPKFAIGVAAICHFMVAFVPFFFAFESSGFMTLVMPYPR
jgi:hypothetical protein